MKIPVSHFRLWKRLLIWVNMKMPVCHILCLISWSQVKRQYIHDLLHNRCCFLVRCGIYVKDVCRIPNFTLYSSRDRYYRVLVWWWALGCQRNVCLVVKNEKSEMRRWCEFVYIMVSLEGVNTVCSLT